eukprot:TRINITY_DN11187_c0_g1_i1.p1 TRINITY_DN11187_c0_g1~~TRINITY_DN11187_c0_g1_i1.p1  ORF type:complete len:296 (+),score=54.48 TRINITY_DN11187_c0_g1_i1:16-903(+)
MDGREDLDGVEIFVQNVRQSLPKVALNFIKELEYIEEYAKQNGLSQWWIYKEGLRALKTTGCGKWICWMTAPFGHEVLQHRLDSLAVSLSIPSFLIGFALGLKFAPLMLEQLSRTPFTKFLIPPPYQLKVSRVNGGDIEEEPLETFSVKRECSHFIFESLPIIFLVLRYIGPRASGDVASSPGTSFSSRLILGTIMGWTALQGVKSAIRLRHNLKALKSVEDFVSKSVDSIRLHNPAEKLVKTRTWERILNLLPAASRWSVMSRHLTPFRRQLAIGWLPWLVPVTLFNALPIEPL